MSCPVRQHRKESVGEKASLYVDVIGWPLFLWLCGMVGAMTGIVVALVVR